MSKKWVGASFYLMKQGFREQWWCNIVLAFIKEFTVFSSESDISNQKLQRAVIWPSASVWNLKMETGTNSFL